MSKKNETVIDGSPVNEQTQNPGQQTTDNGFVDELKAKGSITLSAKSREELEGMISKIPSDIKFIAGPIGQDFDNERFIINLLKR